MKILVIGDLHGQIPKVHFKKFDAVICTGDFCRDKDIWKYIKRQYKKFLKNPYQKRIPWYDEIGRNNARMLIKKSLDAGRTVLKKLNSLGVPVYVIPGNWDLVYEDDEWNYLNKDYYKNYLIKGLKNIKDCHNKIRSMNKYIIIGYGLVNGPELLKHRNYKNITKKSYKRNEKRYRKLAQVFDKRFYSAKKQKKPIIFLSHNVPFNTQLDKIVNKDSPMNGHHYGSNLARDMILKHKPLLNIGGHMHEHYGTCKLGKTIILNAGFGGEKNTLIELENEKIKSMKFYGRQK